MNASFVACLECLTVHLTNCQPQVLVSARIPWSVNVLKSKTEVDRTFLSISSLGWILKRDEKVCPDRNLHADVHCSAICNSQKEETPGAIQRGGLGGSWLCGKVRDSSLTCTF